MLVEIENLTKTFGDFRAVDNVCISIERGEIIGLLGPNGAGKTTTIHMILGLITPTSVASPSLGSRWRRIAGKSSSRRTSPRRTSRFRSG